MKNNSILKKFGFMWVTLALFIFSAIGHWSAGWYVYKQEQEEHNQPLNVNEYLTEMTEATLENWQSEFLQLIWQVAGLTYLLYVGSSQSKEGDDRKEEKLDEILKRVAGKDAGKVIATLDKKYPKN